LFEASTATSTSWHIPVFGRKSSRMSPAYICFVRKKLTNRAYFHLSISFSAQFHVLLLENVSQTAR
jgi:hypothetical protein